MSTFREYLNDDQSINEMYPIDKNSSMSISVLKDVIKNMQFIEKSHKKDKYLEDILAEGLREASFTISFVRDFVEFSKRPTFRNTPNGEVIVFFYDVGHKDDFFKQVEVTISKGKVTGGIVRRK